MINNNLFNSKNELVTASGRRFISDAPKDFHYTSFETKQLLREYSPDSSAPYLYKKESLVELEPHVTLNRDKLSLSFNITSGQNGHSYVLRDIIELIRAIEEAARNAAPRIRALADEVMKVPLKSGENMRQFVDRMEQAVSGQRDFSVGSPDFFGPPALKITYTIPEILI